MKALKYILMVSALVALLAPSPAVARGDHSQSSSYGNYYGGGYGYGYGYGNQRPRAMYCTYYGCYYRRRYRRFSFNLGFPGFNLQFSTGWTPQHRYRPFMGGMFGRGLGNGFVGF